MNFDWKTISVASSVAAPESKFQLNEITMVLLFCSNLATWNGFLP